MYDRRVVVFHDAFGRLVRFLPELQAEFMALKDEGFFALQGGRVRHTEAGWICHILACEINPRRAFERTALRLNHRLYWRARSQETPYTGSEEAYLPHTEAILADLHQRGYIFPEPYGKTQEAWSLIR